jgi:hypothetical protein
VQHLGERHRAEPQQEAGKQNRPNGFEWHP